MIDGTYRYYLVTVDSMSTFTFIVNIFEMYEDCIDNTESPPLCECQLLLSARACR